MDVQSTPRPLDHPAHHPDESRDELRVRHAAALTTLMVERTDLRGVHALADQLDDGIRWTA